MNLFQYIGSLLFKKQQTKQTVSPEMQTAIETWLSLYMGTDGCLRLPSSVASEAARLVLAESKIQASDERMNEHMQRFWKSFCDKTECALALGSMAFKPYVSGDKIIVDMVRADRYVPTAFDSAGEVTAVKLKDAEKQLKDFCKETGQDRDRFREQALGFGRSQAQRAVRAAKKPQNVLTSGADGGIIKSKEAYGMKLIIDKFTPCLEDTKTGKLIPTVYKKVNKSELSQLKGWNFNWLSKELSEADIYKLCITGDNTIQGLVAVTDCKRDMAVYVDIAESAPHNLGEKKRFNGVGGHLFAIAARISVEKNYGGFVFMDAKNKELVIHYSQTLGAVLLGRPHPYRMFIDEENAAKLLSIYTFEEG